MSESLRKNKDLFCDFIRVNQRNPRSNHLRVLRLPRHSLGEGGWLNPSEIGIVFHPVALISCRSIPTSKEETSSCFIYFGTLL